MTCPRHGYPVVKAEHGQVFCDACFAEANQAAQDKLIEERIDAYLAYRAHSVSALAKRLGWQ